MTGLSLALVTGLWVFTCVGNHADLAVLLPRAMSVLNKG